MTPALRALFIGPVTYCTQIDFDDPGVKGPFHRPCHIRNSSIRLCTQIDFDDPGVKGPFHRPCHIILYHAVKSEQRTKNNLGI